MNAIIGKVDKRFNLTYTTIETKGELAYLGKILIKNFKKDDAVDQMLVGKLSEIKPDGAFKILEMGEVQTGNPGELMKFAEDNGVENIYIFDTSIDVWLYYNAGTEEFDPLRTVLKNGISSPKDPNRSAGAGKGARTRGVSKWKSYKAKKIED